MAYSSDLAKLVADQVSRFVTLNPHQLAGQVANLDFWLAEVCHALGVIDGYSVRFVRMEGAQEQHVVAHGTTEFYPGDEFSRPTKAVPPRRVPDRELNKARKALLEAAIRLLRRCRKDRMISEERLADACERLGITMNDVGR